jgi:acetyltransferase-like isoleucine patch superfamily enzyme/dTDP-4-dehydrorhamnose 3,5-epimerase-like enzyme
MMPGFFQHPQAIVETARIGAGTRIWAWAHVLPGAVVGRDCNICDHVFIENDVVIGDRVTVKCGVQLWDGTRLEDDVFVGPNATFTNDPMPRSKHPLATHPVTRVRQGASIGANATILPGVTVGMHAMVGAGAVVTNSVPPYALVAGNPARIVRYVDTVADRGGAGGRAADGGSAPVQVAGVELVNVKLVEDLRGNLVAFETGQGIPFSPARFFAIFDVPSKELRGEHAHRTCQQLLVCLRGSVTVYCDDGRNRQEFLLDRPELGLYVPPMVWTAQYRYTQDAVLLVLASHHYDPNDYIRDHDRFLRERSGEA